MNIKTLPKIVSLILWVGSTVVHMIKAAGWTIGVVLDVVYVPETFCFIVTFPLLVWIFTDILVVPLSYPIVWAALDVLVSRE